MKKSIVSLVILGLAFGALAAPAEAGKKRTMEIRYENPAIGSGATGGACLGCPTLPVGPKERFVSIVITDDVNPGAGVRFRWDTNGDQTSDGGFYVCGKMTEPVEVPSGVTLDAFPYIGGGGPECPTGSATSGTIKATFSSKP